ncbi:MAG: spermidine synthase family protein, partial [Victivallaceae bacterium]
MCYLILLFSGFSSLYYEFLTLKYTEIFLGVSIFAVSIVLLTFLTGMLLGNLLSGRFLKWNSNKRLVLILIITEALIVPAALLTPWLIELTSRIYGANIPAQWPLYARLSIKYLLFLPAFLPLSTLLGLRFPLYLKLFNPGNRIGPLYGVSCLGSAIGAWAGGFFMFEYLNLYTSLIVCVSIVAVFDITGLMIYSKNSIKGKESTAAKP